MTWIEGEIHRNEVRAVVQAGYALAEYDARPFAASVDVPSGLLLTTADRLVRPRKQLALAKILDAEIVELHADHLATLTHPEEYARLTRQLVDSVSRRAGLAPAERSGSMPASRAAG